MKRVKEFILFALVGIVILSIVGFVRSPSFEQNLLPQQYLYNMDMQKLDLKNIRVIHFWATWCPTCRVEIPNIDSVAADIAVVSVAVKSGNNTELKSYLYENSLSLEVVNDQDGAVAKKFGITVFPTTIILKKDGTVFLSESGYISTFGLRLRVYLSSLI